MRLLQPPRSIACPHRTPPLLTPRAGSLSCGMLHCVPMTASSLPGRPSAPSIPFPFTLHRLPCHPCNEKITSYPTWWDSASNPALRILKPQHTHPIRSPIPFKDFLLSLHRTVGMHRASPCCQCQNRASTRYQLPQLSCAGEREDERFGQISTQPRPSRVEREEAKRPLAPGCLACLRRGVCANRALPSRFSFPFCTSLSRAANAEPVSPKSRDCFPMAPPSLAPSRPSYGAATHAQAGASALSLGWTSFWMDCRDLSGTDR